MLIPKPCLLTAIASWIKGCTSSYLPWFYCNISMLLMDVVRVSGCWFPKTYLLTAIASWNRRLRLIMLSLILRHNCHVVDGRYRVWMLIPQNLAFWLPLLRYVTAPPQHIFSILQRHCHVVIICWILWMLITANLPAPAITSLTIVSASSCSPYSCNIAKLLMNVSLVNADPPKLAWS